MRASAAVFVIMIVWLVLLPVVALWALDRAGDYIQGDTEFGSRPQPPEKSERSKT